MKSEVAEAPKVARAFFVLLRRDILLGARDRSELANPLIFYLIVVSLFPLGIGTEPKMLSLIAPGVIWVAALLACMLSTDGLFKNDFDDGALELLLLSPQPLYIMVIAKVLAHWFLTGLPLTVFSPVLAVMLQIPAQGLLPLVGALLLGTISLSFIGAMGAALTVGLQRSGVLMSLIVLPLFIPVLIFGASGVQAAIDGFAFRSHMAVLGAFAMLAISLAPLATSGALRISVNG